jgi:hypothetical protein
VPIPVPYLDESPLASEALSHASILFTDLDGTLFAPGGFLLGNAHGAPSTITAEAIVALARAGLDAVITTGRNRIQCTEISRLVGWPSFIAELGCIIVTDRSEEPRYLTGDWPDDAVLPNETPHEAITRVGALDTLRRGFPGRIEEHTPWHTNREVTHMLRGNIDCAEAQAALDTLELAVDIIDNGIIRPPRHTLVGVTEVHAYHLVPRGTSKTIAIRRMLAERGLTCAAAIAIGDSATDVAMADAGALGVLVRNALDDDRALTAAALRDNIVATRKERGEGWSEFARAWLSARGSDR